MMGRNTIEFKGFVELNKALKKRLNMNDVKKTVRKNGGEMAKLAKQNASDGKAGGVFVKGYSHGNTRSATNAVYTDGGLTAVVEPKTEYASYVEFGTRHMEAEPFLKPAWETQKEQFKADMKKLIK